MDKDKYLSVFAGLALLAQLICACCPLFRLWCPECVHGGFQSITSYPFRTIHTTPKGIRVDDGMGYGADLAKLDARVDAMETCFREEMRKLPVLTLEQQNAWGCQMVKGFGESWPLKRTCIWIKVVPPVTSTCSDQQFIPAKAPDALCRAKGIEPTAECPCLWRTAIQDDRVIITPPAMYLWEIGRLWTLCNNVWASPFARCLSL